METTLTITYRWWSDELPEIKSQHKELLHSRAMERITEGMGDGFVEGDLSTNIYMEGIDDQEGKDQYEGYDYQGWWQVIKN